MLTSVKRTEDSLSKLKRNRKSLVPTTGGMSDDNKIRLQLALDIEQYISQVCILQVQCPPPRNLDILPSVLFSEVSRFHSQIMYKCIFGGCKNCCFYQGVIISDGHLIEKFRYIPMRFVECILMHCSGFGCPSGYVSLFPAKLIINPLYWLAGLWTKIWTEPNQRFSNSISYHLSGTCHVPNSLCT